MNPGKDESIPVSRPAALEVAAPAQALNRRDDHIYEELTRTNNEMANLHREVARQNATLAAAQKKLQASEQRYRSLSACSPIGILEMDVAGRCLYTNPHWQAMTGLAAEESLGDGWRRALDGRDAPGFLEAWNLAQRAGLEFSREFRFVRKDGGQRWAQVRSRGMIAEHGGIAGHVSTVEDITGRKQAEAALERAHQELIEVSRRAGMAEVAAGVLHNVGNALNSVNVSVSCIAEGIRKSKAPNLAKVVELLRGHEADLGQFFTHDLKGKQVPGYLAQLAGHLAGEQAAARTELTELQLHIDHIKEIVTMHQAFTNVRCVTEILAVRELVEDALRLSESSLAHHRVQVIKEFEPVPPITVEKHKALQILINLMRNARQACAASDQGDKRMTLRVMKVADHVRISVTDNGAGISVENLTRIFAHRFAAKRDGHGCGLHNGATAATEMGGSLTAHSDGPGQGATFTLALPLHRLGELP